MSLTFRIAYMSQFSLRFGFWQKSTQPQEPNCRLQSRRNHKGGRRFLITMERKEFLSLLGLGASSLVMTCLAGCSKGSSTGGMVGPTGVDFTLDLTLPANAALLTNGGYVYHNGVLVARTMTGQYIAVQQVCTHENFSVVYQGSNHRFYCGGHGGTFSEAGAVTGGPPPRSLTSYQTSLNGSNLRVYS